MLERVYGNTAEHADQWLRQIRLKKQKKRFKRTSEHANWWLRNLRKGYKTESSYDQRTTPLLQANRFSIANRLRDLVNDLRSHNPFYGNLYETSIMAASGAGTALVLIGAVTGSNIARDYGSYIVMGAITLQQIHKK